MSVLKAGDVLGERFLLVGVLGTGGMATVWCAKDAARKSRVALKVLHPHLAASHSERRRLQREIRATASLRHSAILAPFDLHDFGDVVALSMPIHDGSTLLDHVSDGEMCSAEVLYDLGLRISGALAAAHSLGVLHRDVTPANILVSDGRDAVLADFGLARLAETTATATRAMATPGYTAPEVFAGDRGDPRSDLYGLGACMFFAATGQSPFDGVRVAARVGRQLEGEHSSLRDLRPDLPSDLVATIEALLSAEPGKRPDSASAVVRSLKRRVAAASTDAVYLDSGEVTLWVEAHDEAAISRVLRHRGIVPGGVRAAAVQTAGCWPAIGGVSVTEAESLARDLDVDGVSTVVEGPSLPLASRLKVALLYGGVAGLGFGVAVGLLSALAFYWRWVRVLPESPIQWPSLASFLLVMLGSGAMAATAILFRSRPAPILGRRRALSRLEKRVGPAVLMPMLLMPLAALPVLFVLPVLAQEQWFAVGNELAGQIAFANFALVGGWALILSSVGTSLVGAISVVVAEYRARCRTAEKPWFQAPTRRLGHSEVGLPETVAIARERLASARRWLLGHSQRLPSVVQQDLKRLLARLERQVERLAEQSTTLEAALEEAPDFELEVDVSRIERRLERIRTLGDSDSDLATSLTERLDAFRRRLARVEAIEGRRLRIRAALLQIATTASNTVMSMLDEEHDTEDLLSELTRVATNAQDAMAEVADDSGLHQPSRNTVLH